MSSQKRSRCRARSRTSASIVSEWLMPWKVIWIGCFIVDFRSGDGASVAGLDRRRAALAQGWCRWPAARTSTAGRTRATNGTPALPLPAHPQQILSVLVVELQFALVGVVQRFAQAAREVRVG